MKRIFHPCANRRTFRAARFATVFAFGAMVTVASAGTTDTFNSGTSLLSAGNYASGKLPTNTTDVALTTTTGGLTISGGTATMESLTSGGTKNYTITNGISTAVNSTLTLGNSGGFTNANDGVANDLIALTSSGNLTLTGANSSTGTGTLGVVLASSGNFDVSGTAALTISANISETGGPRTLTFTGNSTGVTKLSGANTFSGGLVLTSGEVDVTADNNLGAAGGSIIINGGRLGIGTNTFTVDSTRAVYLGANPTGGNNSGSLSIKGTITTTFNQGFQNLSGAAGDLVRQGGGTLLLGGTSTYSGSTFLNNGTTRLNIVNALPTGTTVNVGQSASTNNGVLDLNGFNQQVAGLVSITGTNTGSSNASPASNQNIVTSVAGTATLILGGTGTYAFGDGSTQNTGQLQGLLAVNKTGGGTQTFGDVNTYTGGTSVSAGTLILGANGSINKSPTVQITGTGALTLNNPAALSDTGTLSLVSGTALNLNAAAGTSEVIGTLLLDGTSEANGTYTASQLSSLDPGITFTSGSGETLTIGTVPEPATIFSGTMMVGLLAWNQRRRLGGLAGLVQDLREA